MYRLLLKRLRCLFTNVDAQKKICVQLFQFWIDTFNFRVNWPKLNSKVRTKSFLFLVSTKCNILFLSELLSQHKFNILHSHNFL